MMKCHLLWVTHDDITLSTLALKCNNTQQLLSFSRSFDNLKINHWSTDVMQKSSFLQYQYLDNLLPELRAALQDELDTLEAASGRGVVEGEGA